LGIHLTSFRSKVIGITLLVIIGSQIASAFAVLYTSSKNARHQAYQEMEAGIQLFRKVIDNRASVLQQTVRPLAEDSEFKQAIISGDYARINEELTKRIQWIDADVATLLSMDGSVLASAGLNIPRGTALRKLTGEARTSVTINNSTYEMVSIPVKAQTTIGWISIGRRVDDSLAKELSFLTGLELTFLTGMDSGKISFLGSSLPREERDLIINASLQIASGAALYKSIENLKSRYISNREYFFPQGDEIFVVVQKPLTKALASYETLRTSMLHTAITTLVIAFGMALFLSRLVLQPVNQLLLAARRIKVGNYARQINIRSRDELGELASAFDAMRGAIAEREQRIVYQAQHDKLTGLPNRVLALELLSEELRRASQSNTPVAVLVMHLQRFREIQSSLGHEIGDEVLSQAAQRLRETLESEHILAWMEGDQFLIVAPGCDRDSGRLLAKMLSKTLDTGLTIHGINITLDACVGLSVCPEHGRQADELLRRASVAKNDAQRAQQRIHVYQNGREARHIRQLAILGDLHRAVQENELQLYLQPKIRLDSSQTCGAEALLRWEHPELGQISPNEFIPLAESAGNIKMITRWVIEHAIRQSRAWKDLGIHLPIAVNLSARDLMNDSLPRFVAQELDKYEVAAEYLNFEITEEALVLDFDQAANVLTKLKGMGCRTSLDDFGTGYSSLIHLQRLPVDELKIDRTFVTHLPDDEANVAIVRSIISLAHSLKLEVVAEGVETTGAMRWLREEGCEQAQGFYLSKPMPAELFIGWLKNWEKRAGEHGKNSVPDDTHILRPRLVT
jgi:diguanylate cyclase (GGDEF)-like protein